MRITRLATAGFATLLAAPMLGAQGGASQGPTIVAARVAFFAPPALGGQTIAYTASTPCGSHLKNAVLLGLGLSLATGVLELTYTLVREPFVRRGHDVPRADPILIAWAGGAGFVLGIVGTELCRRRRR